MKNLNIVKDDSLLKILPEHATLNAVDVGQIFGVSGDTITERIRRKRFPKCDSKTIGTPTKGGKRLWKVSTIKKFIETLE